jgi:hypothetical protein
MTTTSKGEMTARARARATYLEGLPPGDVVLRVQQLRVVLEDDVVVLLQELGTQGLVLGQEILHGVGRIQQQQQQQR